MCCDVSLFAGGGSFGDIYLGKCFPTTRFVWMAFALQQAAGSDIGARTSQRCETHGPAVLCYAGTNIQTGEEVAIKLVGISGARQPGLHSTVHAVCLPFLSLCRRM